jgi:excinuclease ABC subunit A
MTNKLKNNYKWSSEQPWLTIRNLPYSMDSKLTLPLHKVCLIKGHSQSYKNELFLKLLPHAFKKNDLSLIDCDYNLDSFESIQLISIANNRLNNRSSVGTITDLAAAVRRHFLKSSLVHPLGLKDGHLSSNSELGMCPNCRGSGEIVVEMQFLEDIVLTCEDCDGKKLKPVYANLSDGKFTLYEIISLIH